MGKNQKRQPKGTPTGGRFAPDSRDEIAGTLADLGNGEGNGNYEWELEDLVDHLDGFAEPEEGETISGRVLAAVNEDETGGLDEMVFQVADRIGKEAGMRVTHSFAFDADGFDDSTLTVSVHPDPKDRTLACAQTITLKEFLAEPPPGTSPSAEMELKYELLRERSANAVRYAQMIRDSAKTE